MEFVPLQRQLSAFATKGGPQNADESSDPGLGSSHSRHSIATLQKPTARDKCLAKLIEFRPACPECISGESTGDRIPRGAKSL